MTGARFEKTTLDEKIGPEIVVMLTDPLRSPKLEGEEA
jgi:hypothetical protein